ncbi:MAG: transposase [Mycobacterium sp.]|nr:transposase [Mycobacterium sp.]
MTASETAAACPSCGVFSTAVKGSGEHLAARHSLWGESNHSAVEQDPLAVPGRLLRTRFLHRVHRAGPGRARTTGRLRTQIGAAIGDAARSVAEVATVHGVSWPTAHRAFVAHAKALLAEPEPTRVLGIDQTRRGKPRWTRCELTQRWVRVDPWDTGFVDLAGAPGLARAT